MNAKVCLCWSILTSQETYRCIFRYPSLPSASVLLQPPHHPRNHGSAEERRLCGPFRFNLLFSICFCCLLSCRLRFYFCCLRRENVLHLQEPIFQWHNSADSKYCWKGCSLHSHKCWSTFTEICVFFQPKRTKTTHADACNLWQFGASVQAHPRLLAQR